MPQSSKTLKADPNPDNLMGNRNIIGFEDFKLIALIQSTSRAAFHSLYKNHVNLQARKHSKANSIDEKRSFVITKLKPKLSA